MLIVLVQQSIIIEYFLRKFLKNERLLRLLESITNVVIVIVNVNVDDIIDIANVTATDGDGDCIRN